MKKQLIVLLFLMISCLGFAQEKLSFKEITLTEFFALVEAEPTDTLSLKNAFILSDSSRFQSYRFQRDLQNDSLQAKDTLHIHKYLNLENVVFQPFKSRNLQNIVFRKRLIFRDVIANFKNVRFIEGLGAMYTGNVPKILDITSTDPRMENVRFGSLFFDKCIFDIDPGFLAINAGNDNFLIALEQSTFKGLDEVNGMNLSGLGRIFIRGNKFLGDEQFRIFLPSDNSDIRIENNDFGDRFVSLIIREPLDETVYRNNIHNNITGFSFPDDVQNIDIDWDQFKSGVINVRSLYEYGDYDNSKDQRIILTEYRDSIRIANAGVYRAEIKLLGNFVSLYRRQFDMEFANNSYITLKDLETQRLEFLYRQDPSFDTYFEWKVNQFLKVFSDYGTRPSKAIIMSVYVILIFALVYLFFPNYWDSHGKNRIKDRFLFFHKYLRHPKGIHDVYMEQKQEELENAYVFQKIMDDYRKDVPGFFYKAAKPLYKWSIAGSTFSAGILSKIDFLKGSWKETDPKSRRLKTGLTFVVFFIAILYDLFIKMLNALMLSINTFTTLGFGEIPIKGLPRYLAIIQGFIGWFMLTIFSVSLISQLLN